YLPYLAVGTFVVSLCRDAYIVGVISPVATTAYVCLIMVGLVLFHRTLVYSMLIPASIFLGGCAYLSFSHQLPYSPLFNIDDKLFYNGFWLLSMRSEEHTSELQSRENLVCRLLLEKKKQ